MKSNLKNLARKKNMMVNACIYTQKMGNPCETYTNVLLSFDHQTTWWIDKINIV